MAHVDTHTPGSFCWVELGTTDQNAAKRFYSALLGWQADDSPMGPGQFYTTFSMGGRKTAGCYTLMPDMIEQRIPPHWMLYVAVESADATSAKVEPAGGKLMCPAFDVFDFGRMAPLRDPTGAVISIWQPKTHQGIGIHRENGAFCWADLSTPEPENAAKFYQQVFGWTTDQGKDGSGYMHIKNADEFIGGIPPAQHRNPNAPPHWLLYFQVENCDASTDKAKSAGANVLVPPMTMEGVGRWSIVADPQGAVLALFQPGR